MKFLKKQIGVWWKDVSKEILFTKIWKCRVARVTALVFKDLVSREIRIIRFYRNLDSNNIVHVASIVANGFSFCWFVRLRRQGRVLSVQRTQIRTLYSRMINKLRRTTKECVVWIVCMPHSPRRCESVEFGWPATSRPAIRIVLCWGNLYHPLAYPKRK